MKNTSRGKSCSSTGRAATYQVEGITKAEALEILKTAEDKMCLVWSMIKGNVDVDVKIEISE